MSKDIKASIGCQLDSTQLRGGGGVLDDLIASDKYWAGIIFDLFSVTAWRVLRNESERGEIEKMHTELFLHPPARLSALRRYVGYVNNVIATVRKTITRKSIRRRLVMKSRIVQISLIKFPSIFFIGFSHERKCLTDNFFPNSRARAVMLINLIEFEPQCWSIKLKIWWSTAGCLLPSADHTITRWLIPRNRRGLSFVTLSQTRNCSGGIFSPTFTTPRPSQKSSGYFIFFACLN